MVQNLIISGKEYLPSAELAQHFGYTADYVSRLAREGKIAATTVDRKWFVDKDSLDEFRQLASLGKDVRSTELKKQRKVERLMHSQKEKVKNHGHVSHVHIALVESVVVFMCGVFVVLLGWTAVGSDIGFEELTVGLEKSYMHITQKVVPNTNPLGVFAEWSVATVPQRILTEEIVSENNTQELVSETVKTNIHDKSFVGFSDEVDITFDADGTGVVRPVFKNNQDGQEYQMLLAPANEGG